MRLSFDTLILLARMGDPAARATLDAVRAPFDCLWTERGHLYHGLEVSFVR